MFELPDLPYGYDALEPVISEVTLQLHHGKHHARYVAMTNSLADGLGTDFQSLEDLVALSARRGASCSTMPARRGTMGSSGSA